MFPLDWIQTCHLEEYLIINYLYNIVKHLVHRDHHRHHIMNCHQHHVLLEHENDLPRTLMSQSYRSKQNYNLPLRFSFSLSVSVTVSVILSPSRFSHSLTNY